MIIVYESKTGFTKKYADMLAEKTKLNVYRANEITRISQDEDIIFLGWMKVGKIQGLNKLRKYRVVAVCGSGTAETAEPDSETVIARNKIENKPFFYLRGGCLPLRDLKGMDKIMLSMFVKILKSRKDKDEKTEEAILNIENGFDGVKEENLEPVLNWINAR
ncbi:MAG: flavodoxin domain-containing protein [Clostridiales bacterium]|nr:flavodoxin domain-containing protein [Clostridiales bacterium]